MANIDSNVHRDLIYTRFAYVAGSRTSHDAQIYTNSTISHVH